MRLYKSIFKDKGHCEIIIIEKVLYFRIPDKSLEFVYNENHKITWNYDNNNDRDKELKTMLLGLQKVKS
jgi:hypothetical protein